MTPSISSDRGEASEARRQHEAWAHSHVRLWTGYGRQVADTKPTKRVALPVERPKPVLPPPLWFNGWPLYMPPAPYDAFDGQIPSPPPMTIMKIAREVARKHGLHINEMLSPRRDRTVVAARHEAFYRCKMETTRSLPEIGRRLGGKDHTTVLHGIRQHEKRMAMEAKARSTEQEHCAKLAGFSSSSTTLDYMEDRHSNLETVE